VSATATTVQPAVPVPPARDRGRAQVRAAVGAAQVAYGVLRLRRTRSGWYHVVLGARQLVQARLDAAGAFSPAADAAVDGLHVATMLSLALFRRGHRRSALLGAAHAAAWTLLDAAISRQDAPDVPPGAISRTRA
jgi:S-formylglutathione hydrolase FrmB